MGQEAFDGGFELTNFLRRMVGLAHEQVGERAQEPVTPILIRWGHRALNFEFLLVGVAEGHGAQLQFDSGS